MGDFHGIKPGATCGFAEAGSGRFMSVTDLPGPYGPEHGHVHG